MKRINIYPGFKEEDFKEAEIMKKLDHPNIIKYYDMFKTGSGKYLCIIMEYASGGNLRDLMRNHFRKEQFQEDTEDKINAMLS